MKIALARLDARWLVLGNNALLVVWGLAFFGLQRSAVQITTCLVATLATELAAARATGKLRRTGLGDRLLSASTAAVSTLLLLVSPAWWFYAVIGSVAILSKYLILDAAGGHVFNPTNFAIVLAIALLPDWLLVRPDQFSGSPLLFAQIVLFGVAAVLRGARYRTTLGYYAAVLGFALPVGSALGVKPLWILAPEMNTSILIFACLMITDPRTTPGSPRGQWLFGLGVGLVHECLRYLQVPYSAFIALFVVAGLRSISIRPPGPAAIDRTAGATG